MAEQKQVGDSSVKDFSGMIGISSKFAVLNRLITRDLNNNTNADGSLSQELTQASAAATGKFAYAPASKAITFHTDVTDGTEVVVYYKRRIKADVLNNESDVYSEKCTLYVDALGEDKCGNVYRIQFFIPKADFSGEFSLEMGENQTAHAFEAESLAGACGAGGSLWTYTVFGVNTADAE